HDGLRLDSFQFLAFCNPPKNVLRLIAADAEVGRLERAEALLPDLFRAAPALSDGIAQEEDVHVPLLGAFDEAVVQVNPPLVLASGRVDGRVSWLRVLGAYEERADEGGGGSQRENDETTHQNHEALLRFGWRTQTVDRLATGWVRAARYRNPGDLACPRSGLRKTKRPTDVRPWARVKIV